jgi:hypothetical protein
MATTVVPLPAAMAAAPRARALGAPEPAPFVGIRLRLFHSPRAVACALRRPSKYKVLDPTSSSRSPLFFCLTWSMRVLSYMVVRGRYVQVGMWVHFRSWCLSEILCTCNLGEFVWKQFWVSFKEFLWRSSTQLPRHPGCVCESEWILIMWP